MNNTQFYASQTDNKQKLITKGITLEQVPPEVGIFRGTVGGDCSSQLSLDNQEIISALIDLLNDPRMQKTALSILGKNIIKDPEHHLIIARFFTHEDNDLYTQALWIIMNNEIENEKIINDIVELLKHENMFRRRWAVQALGNLKPSDPEIHLSMARLLVSSRQIRPVILRALAKVKVQNPKVHELIRKLSQDTNKEVKEAALAAMASLGIPN